MVVPKVPTSSEAKGNTKPSLQGKKKQVSPAKHWVFTLNNYTKKDLIQLEHIDSSKVPILVYQSEIGDNGTPHIQGCLSFNTKGRPFNLTLSNRIHWEKKSKHSTLEQMRFYCADPDKRDHSANIVLQRGWKPKVKYIENINIMYDWEKDLLKKIDDYKPDRTIHYIWEEKGCTGKTTFQKWLFTHYENTIVLSGNATDMKNGIVQYQKENNCLPKIIIINIPRSKEIMSWCGIEEIKDMFFFCGKYEGGMVCGECPFVCIFANKPPPLKELSLDRWVIKYIGKGINIEF